MQKATHDFVLAPKTTDDFVLPQKATHDFGLADIKPLRFIGESIKVQFDKQPMLEKKPGCPSKFVWRGKAYKIVELLQEWHDYSRRGRMAHNMRPERATSAQRRGSWGVGRDYYRILTDTGQIFDLYYDRAPKKDNRKGVWFLYQEMSSSEK